jgi:ATP-dependent Lhr-like helicase
MQRAPGGNPGPQQRSPIAVTPESTLAEFHPIVRNWFVRTFGAPSPPQALGWPSISAGRNTLILAPTGSGKTLAAFLWAINHLVEQHLHEALPRGVRILYVSPLKALNNDIERNLERPLAGIAAEARSTGLSLPPITTAVRTGDTPQSRRAAMAKRPPDILITTPESLYLILTAKASRGMLRTVQYVIVDEIHSLCGNKRGVHLSLSLERLQELAAQDFVRIGLSATQRPLDRIAAFLGGVHRTGDAFRERPVAIVDAGRRKEMDMRVECAAPDFALLPQEGIWSLVFRELLELIRLHTTTLVFVNNRRLAERVAARLNEELAQKDENGGPSSAVNLRAVPRRSDRDTGEIPLVQAYHGSMSRTAREQMETDLKAGKLRALVATSSLELGIDIGSIDLVVQLQSPKGVARGLQRIGRSGHLVTATSKGRIFPTHREDLVEAAVVGRAMEEHDVEETEIPENCLDVLAQQIVAMVSVEEQDVDGLYALVRRSYCYRSLARNLFDGVVQMLAGRYTDEAFRELRARISWDRVNGVLRSLPGSGRLAVTNGGTIADRGYFGVYLQDGVTKVGEVDEEFVYESRVGDTFILGTSVWRVASIDASRLAVEPAPGQPARMPFWRGEGIGRTYTLGLKVGAFRRDLAERAEDPGCLSHLKTAYPIDSRAAWNLREYFRKQAAATGVVPSDRLVLIEGFRDEIGDPRIVVHSSFGRRVNGLLGLVLSHRLHAMAGVEPQMLYNDDGILLRCADADALPLGLLDGITTAEARTIALEEVLSSPLFAGQFRQNAARALLMPKSDPGRRTPLWLQRLRAGDLLQIARRYDDFPIVIETIRDVLHDVLDFNHFIEVVRGIETGTIAVATVQTDAPSPFSASLLFDFMAVYMYEWDQPKEDRQTQYLAINRELLAEIVDLEALPPLIRPEAIALVEAQLQHTADGTRARSPEELMEILVRVGDLSEEEIVARCEGDGRALLSALAADGRAVRREFPSGPRWIAGEDRAAYDAIGDEAGAAAIIGRFLRSRGPVGTGHLAARFGLPAERVDAIARRLESSRDIVRGRFRAGGGETSPAAHEWCSRPAMEQMHRRTIALLRKEITPCPPAVFTRFLLSWQGVSRSESDLASVLGRLQGLALPPETWERDILRARLPSLTSGQLSAITASGDGVWVGTPAGRLLFLFRGNGNLFLSPPEEAAQDRGESAGRVLDFLDRHGASFFGDIREGTRLSLASMNKAIARLFWGGLVTNDVSAEVMGVKRPPRAAVAETADRIEIIDPHHAPMRGRIMQSARKAFRQVPGWSGRWSLVHSPGVMGPAAGPQERAAAQARQLLERYGIVAREFHRREDLLPWPLLAACLQGMEMRGEVRRGYFVEGFSGMQYALPAAVEELRRLRGAHTDSGTVTLLNSCDPANPYGTGTTLPLPGGSGVVPRFSRVAGTFIAFADGAPLLIIEGYGSRLRTVGAPAQEALRTALGEFVGLLQLPAHHRPLREIVIEYCDDQRPADSALGPALRSLGFVRDKNQTMRRDAFG